MASLSASNNLCTSSGPWDRMDWLVVILVLILIPATRIPFQFTTFSHIDSVHFALAVEEFDVSRYRPHPPGYIMFVGTAKLFNLIQHDVALALFSTVLFYSVFSVVLLYVLTRAMFNRTVAVVAISLFGTVPVFWFHGDVALSYVAASCFATLIGLTAYKATTAGGRSWFYLTFFLLGLSGGVRQDLMVFMAPLVFLMSFLTWNGVKRFAAAILALVAGVLAWIEPTVLLSGGLSSYLGVLSEQTSVFVKGRSVFSGGSLLAHTFMLKDYLLAMWGATFPGLIYVLVFLLKKDGGRERLLTDRRFWFLTVWIAPVNLFLVIVFFLNHGYLLTALPAVYIGIAWAIVWFTRTRLNEMHFHRFLILQTIAVLAVHCYMFMGRAPVDPGRSLSIPAAEKSGEDQLKSLAFKAFFLNNYRGITSADAETNAFVQGLRNVRCLDSTSALLILHRSQWGITQAMYYLHHPLIFFVDDYGGSNKVRIASGDSLWFEETSAKRPARLPSSIQCLVVISEKGSPAYAELSQQMQLETVDLEKGLYYFMVRRVPDRFNVQYAYFAVDG
jgi:hypothetical protein